MNYYGEGSKFDFLTRRFVAAIQNRYTYMKRSFGSLNDIGSNLSSILKIFGPLRYISPFYLELNFRSSIKSSIFNQIYWFTLLFEMRKRD